MRWIIRGVLVALACLLAPVYANAQCTCIPARSFAPNLSMTYWIDPNYFTQTQIQRFSTSVTTWRTAINDATGSTSKVAKLYTTSNESGATWKIRGNESWRGTSAVAETEHSTKTIWVNPDRLEAGNPSSYSDDRVHNMLLHEIGHTLGYVHTTCTASVMYTFSQLLTTLSCGDEAALEANYYCPDCYSPIIIDVDCRNTQLSGPEVPFDINGDGDVELMGWTIPAKNDAFLVFERDGTRAIESGRELFGNFTPLSWDMTGPVASHGFEVLAWFDRPENYGNGDGWIDQSDYIYSQLQVWLDENHNGISEPSELLYLEQRGIKRISTTAEFHNRRDSSGNRFAYRGTVAIEDDGKLKECSIFDVFLVVKDE